MNILKDGIDKKGNYDLLWKYVKNQKLRTVIDIGAWWGPWTLWWQTHVKKIEIFEPNTSILPMLEHNVKEFKNCTVHKTALGSTSGSVSMKYETHSGTNHISSFNGDIKLKTLDSYSFTEVDIIKIDVEGFEVPVLEGAEETILSQKPWIQIESNSSGNRYKRHKIEIKNFLKNIGMTVIDKKWPDQVWIFK